MRNFLFLFIFIMMVIPCFGMVYRVDSSGEGDFDSIDEAIALAHRHDVIKVACHDWDPNYIATIDLDEKDILITRDCAGERAYFDRNGFHSGVRKVKPAEPDYVAGELIVKYKRSAADAVEMESAGKRAKGISTVPQSIRNLNSRHKLKLQKPLFKNFKKHRQQIAALAAKKSQHLTMKERRIARRLKRAPKLSKVPELDRIYLLEFDNADDKELQQILADYQADANVEYAELNYMVSIDQVPQDEQYPGQWGLNNTGQDYPTSRRYTLPPGTADKDIDAPEAWDIETGSNDVIVAVIDTGVDYNHRDLAGNIWVNRTELNGVEGIDDDGNGYEDDIFGYDFINGDGDPKDDNGHGTHCAGIIAARGDNTTDIAGVSWRSKIMSLKHLGATGRGDVTDAVDAIYYAVHNGADVISNSWGRVSNAGILDEAINYAYSQGVVVVASAGNTANRDLRYPANSDHVISVAATDSKDQLATFSTYGSWVDIAAPGVDILSLRADRTYLGTIHDDYTTIVSGTSMACPFVSGGCALLFSIDPNLTVDQIENTLKSSTDTIASSICQSGRLNVNKVISGIVISEGKIRFDSEIYGCSGEVVVEVRDLDLMGDGTLTVTLTSNAADTESMTLTEVHSNTGIFKGSIGIAGNVIAANDGTLQLADGQVITVTYNDGDNGSGSAAIVTDTASIDCRNPLILNVEVVESTHRSVKIRVEVDEPVSIKLNIGQSCGDYSIISKGHGVGAIHTIDIKKLKHLTDYYFVVEAVDPAGNVTADDNGGVCYSFTTSEFFGFYVPSLYPTIQSAIDAASEGDEIIIEDGVYTGDGNRNIDFNGKDILVRSENGPENCIIDCQGLGRGFFLHSDETRAAVIKGLTIVNGYGVTMPGTNGSWGGGILCCYDLGRTASPTIDNCVIRNCYAEIGAGVYARLSYPLIINCEISNNSGEGVYMDSATITLNNCKIAENLRTGIYIGHEGTSNTKISNCNIINNGGDGIYSSHGFPKIDNSLISDNKETGIEVSHGGLSISNSTIKRHKSGGIIADRIEDDFAAIPFTVRKCIISDNSTTQSGGGIYLWSYGNGLVENCFITGNHSNLKGGGIYNYAGSKVTIDFINCTIANNSSDEYAGGVFNSVAGGPYTPVGYTNIRNCIIWGNSAPERSQMVTSAYNRAEVSYCDIQGFHLGDLDEEDIRFGSGMIDSNPQFSLSGDYHLSAGSPCVDAGANYVPEGIPQEDFYGRDRRMDGDNNGTETVDMGAYEFEYNSDTPLIAIDEDMFVFSNLNGQPNPESQYLSIRNILGGELNWQVTGDSFWLEVFPPSGVSTGEINQVEIKVDTTALSHGEYTGMLSISDSNSINASKSILVKLHIADQIRVPENYPTIQEAIDAVGDFSTIIVDDGTYTGEGNRDISFRGRAISLKSENGPDNCIIDCENVGRGFVFDTYEEANTVLDGFTIINGNPLSQDKSMGQGGGLYIYDSSPTVKKCKILNCQALYYTGGVFCQNSSTIIDHCVISGNTSNRYAGGISSYGTGAVTIAHCSITNNTADREGGGVKLGDDSIIMNSLITGNKVNKYGGGVYSSGGNQVLTNCTIFNNLAGDSGGAVYISIGREGKFTLNNCVLWNNFPEEACSSSGTLFFEHCNVMGGEPNIVLGDIYSYLDWGDGNIDSDPIFTDTDGADYIAGTEDDDFRLMAGSPCIDKGDESSVISETDIIGNTRVIYDNVDMGAYEFGIVGDTDKDLDVDTVDLQTFASNWLDDSQPRRKGDFDRNGTVNLKDYAILAENWMND